MSAVSLHKHKTKPTLLHVKVQITPENISKFCGAIRIKDLLEYIDIPWGEYKKRGFFAPNQWTPNHPLSELVRYHALNKNPDP